MTCTHRFVVANFVICLLGCSGASTPASPPDAVPEIAPTAPAASLEAPARQVFGDGHYALTLPGALAFTGSTDSTGGAGLMKVGDVRLEVLYQVAEYGDPTAMTDTGLHAFVLSEAISKANGRETDRVVRTLAGPGVPTTEVTWVVEGAGEASHHITAVFSPDPHTTISIEGTRPGQDVDRAWFDGVLDSFEIASPRTVVLRPEEGSFDLATTAPTAGAAEIAAAPRSTKPGEPGLATSCNMIGLNRQCYETADAVVNEGYYGNRGACENPNDSGVKFGDQPCPAAGRIGACVLAGEGQVAHLYDRETLQWKAGEAQGMCEKTWGGRWVGPESRPWPINPK